MKIKRDFIGMFDAMKGILMLVVTLAHTNGFAALLLKEPADAAALFPMYSLLPIAMFFMIAGYSFKLERDWKGYLKRQAKSLLLPYLLTPIVAIPLRAVLYLCMGRFAPDRLSRIALGFLYGATQPFDLWGQAVDSVDAMWFLPALFFGGLLHQALMRVKHPVPRNLGLWGIVIFAACLPAASVVRVPWFLVQACTCLGFLELGRLLKARRLLYVSPHPLAVLAALALWVFFHLYSSASLWANVWTFGPLDYLGSALIAGVLLRLYLQTGVATAWAARPIAWIGRYSLYFLFFHSLELVVLPWSDTMAGELERLGLSAWAALLLIWPLRSAFAAAGSGLVIWGQRRLRRRTRKVGEVH